MTQEEERQYRLARSRVVEKKKFYNHLTTYLVMGAFFFVLNAVTSFGTWWFYWPMLGWGIGVAMQYFKVFGFPGSGLGSAEWEEREMQKQMNRLDPPRNKDKKLDMDNHLELREIKTRKEKIPSYRKDDLV
jgi:hypothetical protein